MSSYYAEPDHEPDEEMEDHEINEHMDPGVRIRLNRREDDDLDESVSPSFYDRYGFDERDGPPEEEENGYGDDPPHCRW